MVVLRFPTIVLFHSRGTMLAHRLTVANPVSCTPVSLSATKLLAMRLLSITLAQA